MIRVSLVGLNEKSMDHFLYFHPWELIRIGVLIIQHDGIVSSNLLFKSAIAALCVSVFIKLAFSASKITLLSCGRKITHICSVNNYIKWVPLMFSLPPQFPFLPSLKKLL